MQLHRVETVYLILLIGVMAMSLSNSIAEAEAAILQVSQDGTSDYSRIQDAVEAAGDGDVIEIGPGRYVDFFDAPYGIRAVIYIDDKSLSFVGAGGGQTVVGPEVFGQIEGSQVYCAAIIGDGLDCSFEGIQFENVQRYAIYVNSTGRGEIDNCIFRGSSGGIYAVLGGGGWIRDCEFIDINTEYQNASINFYEPTTDMSVERCEFRDCYIGVTSSWGGCENIEIADCVFANGDLGVSFQDGASGVVFGCQFTGQSRYALAGVRPGSFVVEGNTIDVSGGDAYCLCAWDGPGDYTLHGNTMIGDQCLLGIFDPRGEWDCRDNVFTRAGASTFYIRPAMSSPYTGPPLHLDFSNNWWGTDDPDLVGDWIFDGNDNPDHHFFVDYLPMNGVVSAEGRSWSSVKGLFDGGGGE